MPETQDKQKYSKNLSRRIRLCAATFASFTRSRRMLKLLLKLPADIEQDIKSALHHNAVISYCIPFMENNGLGTYSLKEFKKTPEFDMALHQHLLQIRNQLMAHIDDEFRTSRIFTTSIEGNFLDTEGNRLPTLTIPTKISVTHKIMHELIDKELNERYLKHINAAFESVVNDSHRLLIELQKFIIENPAFDLEKEKKCELPITPTQQNQDKISFELPNLVESDILKIPNPNLKIGKDSYTYESIEIFINFKDWEVELD